MAKGKGQGNRVTFNQMIEQLKAQKIDTSSDPNLHYLHLIIDYEPKNRKALGLLSQRLGQQKSGERYSQVVIDERYRKPELSVQEDNQEDNQQAIEEQEQRASILTQAFILRGKDADYIRSAVQQASEGLGLEYQIRDY